MQFPARERPKRAEKAQRRGSPPPGDRLRRAPGHRRGTHRTEAQVGHCAGQRANSTGGLLSSTAVRGTSDSSSQGPQPPRGWEQHRGAEGRLLSRPLRSKAGTKWSPLGWAGPTARLRRDPSQGTGVGKGHSTSRNTLQERRRVEMEGMRHSAPAGGSRSDTWRTLPHGQKLQAEKPV